VKDLTDRTGQNALNSLFLVYGRPQIINNDNGAGLIDESIGSFGTAMVLVRWM
jgi:hypothetical protein